MNETDTQRGGKGAYETTEQHLLAELDRIDVLLAGCEPGEEPPEDVSDEPVAAHRNRHYRGVPVSIDPTPPAVLGHAGQGSPMRQVFQ